MKKFFTVLFCIMAFAPVCWGAIPQASLRYNEKDAIWQGDENTIGLKDVRTHNSNRRNIPDNQADIDQDWYGVNCFYFVDRVLSDEQRGSVKGGFLENRAYLNGFDDKLITNGQYLNSEHNGNGPTSKELENVFANAQAGDVVQMYWYGTQHTAFVNGIDDNGVEFFEAHCRGYGVRAITSDYYTWQGLAEQYSKSTLGGVSVYRFGSSTTPTPTPTPTGDVAINAANFPDEIFRNFVKQYDLNGNMILSIAEAKAVDSLGIANSGIEDLKGIEYFTALTNLWCVNNNLTTLDLSNNKALTTLNCWGNQLTTLNVNKNTSLEYLHCENNCLTTLDVSNNKALTHLDCSNNQLTALDVSNNKTLTTLNCSGNQLTTLDVSNNKALEWLRCEYNRLTALNVSGCTTLVPLNCSDNQLTTLDVSGCTRLQELYCYNNQLTALKLGNHPDLLDGNMVVESLYTVDCQNNKLTEIDISGCPNLINSYLNRYSLYFWYDLNVKIITDGSSSTGTTAVKPTITTKFRTTYLAQNENITIPVEATGTAPLTWTVEGLPTGMYWDEAQQVITGAPSQIQKCKIKISVSNSTNKTAKKSFTVYVVPPVKILVSSLQEAIYKKTYKLKMLAEGGKKLIWSAIGLPNGMKISKAGKISGKPKEIGIFEVIITAASKKIAEGLPGSFETIKLLLTINETANNTAVPEIVDIEEISSENFSEGPYKIAAVLPVISVDVSGQHEIPATISDDVSEGAKLFWLANSSEPSDDDDIAEFFDAETGEEIFAVPSSRKIIVSPWLNKGVIYEPYIMAR